MTFRPPRTWRGRVQSSDLNREIRDQFRELRDAISVLESSGGSTGSIPVGTVLLSGRTDVPTDYLICDGQAISINSYPDLYDICGAAYGAPTTTTFVLPDFTNRFVRGASALGDGTISSRGTTGGYTNNNGDIASGTLTWSSVALGGTAQGTNHTHSVATSHAHGYNHSHTTNNGPNQSHSHGSNSHDHGGNTPTSNNANRASGTANLISPSHAHGIPGSNRGSNNDSHTHSVATNSNNVNLNSNFFGSAFTTNAPTTSNNEGGSGVTYHSHSTSHTHDATHNHPLADKRPEHDDVNYLVKALPEPGEGEDWFIAGSAILGTSMIGA